MRNTLPLLSRTPAPSNRGRSPSPSVITPPQHVIPTIKFTAATPSVAGTHSANTSLASTILTPKARGDSFKRVVPKKSKLSLLSMGSKRGERQKDFSDVIRRVGAPTTSTNRSFDIYVDPTDDPDIGEVVKIVKKKKSRAGLDDLQWGPLGDVTNVSKGRDTEKSKGQMKIVPSTFKSKGDDKEKEKEKWWTLGRIRRDSKEKSTVKEKEGKQRKAISTNTPAIVTGDQQQTDPRQRAHSFDSGILLNTPTLPTVFSEKSLPEPPILVSSHDSVTPPATSSPPLRTSSDSSYLSPPSADKEKLSGSIAQRAIRSVRSLARIGSWAQLRNGPADDLDSDGFKADKKKEKREKTRSAKSSSGSSFEAGGLTPMKGTVNSATSIINIGRPQPLTPQQPGTLSSLRSNENRMSGLSIASSLKSISTMSHGSSIEPILSDPKRTSKRSSGSSVRWEDQIDTVKEKRPISIESTTREKRARESRRSSEGRKRPALSILFPETGLGGHSDDIRYEIPDERLRTVERPVLTLEVASPDRKHDAAATLLEVSSVESAETPVKKARPRPLSEQMLGRARPRGIVGDEAEGVMSILDAATTDLANLINRLDLEATPDASPRGGTPGTLRARVDSGAEQSPLKRGLKGLSTESSISSLRPYAQSRGGATSSGSSLALLGQQIAPWPIHTSLDTVTEGPAKDDPDVSAEIPVFRLTHKRTLSPPAPSFEPMPVFHPLPAAKAKSRQNSKAHLGTNKSISSQADSPQLEQTSVVTSSSMTFGVRPTKVMNGPIPPAAPSPTIMEGRRIQSHFRRPSSLVPLDISDSSGNSVTMDSKARRALDMHGTMGSMGSVAEEQNDDPDSDIPEELQIILCSNSDRGSVLVPEDTCDSEVSQPLFRLPPSPGVPPAAPLPPVEHPALEAKDEVPIFRAHLVDDQDNEADIEETSESSDDETRKSFDFTGELQKLNESGASDRHSFIMQLESAFKTQANINIKDLGANLGLSNDLLHPDVPRSESRLTGDDSGSQATRESASIDDMEVDIEADVSMMFSEIQNLVDPCAGRFTLANTDMAPAPHTVTSKASEGRLNMDFKFGGKPLDAETNSPVERPLTLSDIIPPPSHHTRNQSVQSITDEDNSVMKSIMAKAIELHDLPTDQPRLRLDSDSSSKLRARHEALMHLTAHSRQSSEASNFSGMSSFSEVRRGFEFGPGRPAFYPPPGANKDMSSRSHNRYDSAFSIASVSSYGAVVRNGSNDPFGYGLPVRPISEDMSISIDDTFSFLRYDPVRKRVDSDASSFYFNSSSQNMQSKRRHRRQNDSLASVASGPPISLYNRSYSYAGHRRNDSSLSASSLAHTYGVYGASTGRAIWARHQRERSMDSTTSGFSARHLGRPGVGDKMFESAHDYAAPLSSILASPSQSETSRGLADRTSFDSIMDDDRRSSVGDSLFDQTGKRSSASSGSVFGYDDNNHAPLQQPHLLPPSHFRPVSMLSIDSVHSSKREDDTMITMFDGGHVRRRSVGSAVGASPCLRVEKRKHDEFQNHRIHTRTPSDEGYDDGLQTSANRARIIQPPSLASLESRQFGHERIALAQKGLLERRSLEESCLSGEGEDVSMSDNSLGVFRKPGPASRNRSASYAPASSGAETPPLSISDSSSQSSGSQSSIDLSRLSAMLTNITNPVSSTKMGRSRARARGHGHRKRISEARVSRSSVYETIEEEAPGLSNSPSPMKTQAPTSEKSAHSLPAIASYSIHEPTIEIIEWDDDEVGPALRKYYALKNEAHETVVTSKRTWEDTPFSIYALQSFDPPRHPAGMQALLEHSQKTYGPLPSDLKPHRRRSRTLSRPSPYPRSRKISQSSDEKRPFFEVSITNSSRSALGVLPLQELPVNNNVLSPTPVLKPMKPFTPFTVRFEDKAVPISVFKDDQASREIPAQVARPRVPSNARRNALGWSKRNNGKTSQEKKENSAYGALMSPNESLRVIRPRPRGRLTPSARAINV